MKKYRTINFFEGHDKNAQVKKYYKIIILFVLIVGITKIYTGIKEIRSLQEYIYSNPYENSENIKTTYRDYVNINQVKKVYNLIGVNNVKNFSVRDLDVEIEGTCKNLDILEKIKENENVSNMSINKVIKSDESYIFNINYSVGDKFETE